MSERLGYGVVVAVCVEDEVACRVFCVVWQFEAERYQLTVNELNVFHRRPQHLVDHAFVDGMASCILLTDLAFLVRL